MIITYRIVLISKFLFLYLLRKNIKLLHFSWLGKPLFKSKTFWEIPVGHFTNVSQALQNISLKICVLQKSYFLWEFQADTLYVCPKPCFGHTYKVSAWNSPIDVISGIVYFSEIILESSRNVNETTPRTTERPVYFPCCLATPEINTKKTHPCDCIISLPLHPYVASYGPLHITHWVQGDMVLIPNE